ncbi:MAG: wax ester/triacylglycerol synthase family O-acyltransferase [Microthrixaceae bacterium]
MKVMSGLDARFLYSETSTAHMHTMKVVVVDISGRAEPLSREGIPAAIEQRLQRMPVLRRRIIPAPHGLGNPIMVDDPEFELSRHLRHTVAAPPGGQRELDEVVAAVATTPLPRDRPLWELTVVEGLDEGRVAFVMKLHHALADGVASVAMLENAFMADGDDAVTEPFVPGPLPTPRQLYRASAAGAAHAARTLPYVVRRTVSGARHARAVSRTTKAMLPGPFAGPRTPFNRALTADRTFAVATVALPILVAAKAAAGASLNDAFLALCGGAIRRHLRRLGALPDRSLVASVPLATRTQHHRLGGNHVDNLFLPVRNDLSDPLERIRAVHDSSVAGRRVREQFGSDLFERRSGLVPAGIHGLLPRVWGSTHLANHLRPPLNLVASCVRGPRRRLEIDGGVVTSLFSVGPILEGIGLNITAWTYLDVMYISVLGCSATLPDPWALRDDLHDEVTAWETLG